MSSMSRLYLPQRVFATGASLLVVVVSLAPAARADIKAGHLLYDSNCSVCHGSDLMGGELGPAIVNRIARLDDERLQSVIP